MQTIAFHKKLYTLKSLESAVKQFRDFGTFRITSKGRYHRVSIPDGILAEDAARLTDEFRNYALYLEITHEST